MRFIVQTNYATFRNEFSKISNVLKFDMKVWLTFLVNIQKSSRISYELCFVEAECHSGISLSKKTQEISIVAKIFQTKIVPRQILQEKGFLSFCRNPPQNFLIRELKVTPYFIMHHHRPLGENNSFI